MNFRDFETSLLALVVWREARGEGYPAMLAVACSIRNRVERPSWWGHTFAEVIGKKWQYSSMAAPNDPQLLKYPLSELDQNFSDAMKAATDTISGLALSPVPGADSYYDTSIRPPKWATPETFVAAIGALRFHNLDKDVESADIEQKLWP
jgi:spore germination cell wall hydrolase CwlJ-like protein